jgi:adenosylhomocysteine nucleosidase
MIGAPHEKRELARIHEVAAVDMESATVARYCERHKVPFGCLRAISDDVDTALSPELVSLLAGGQVSLPRVFKALARRPALLAELWRLARHTRLASEQLAQALVALLRLDQLEA